MFLDADGKENYSMMIESIKTLLFEKRNIVTSDEYKTGKSIVEKRRSIRSDGIAAIKKMLQEYLKFKHGEKYSMAMAVINTKDYGKSDYFSSERIAIYTCITGGYDTIVEPLFVPNNCDFYAITDFELPVGSKWKRMDISAVENEQLRTISGSPVLINRFFKMNPHIVFTDYKFSVYIDGNIRVCTDMTEYINRLSSIGVGTFAHSQRNCAYEEAKACIAMRKETDENIKQFVMKLRQEEFPEGYGLAQCSIIAREHDSELCKTLMEEWWREFCIGPKRDQLSFPLVMYRNGVTMDKITTLGANLYSSDSFEIVRHIK